MRLMAFDRAERVAGRVSRGFWRLLLILILDPVAWRTLPAAGRTPALVEVEVGSRDARWGAGMGSEEPGWEDEMKGLPGSAERCGGGTGGAAATMRLF